MGCLFDKLNSGLTRTRPRCLNLETAISCAFAILFKASGAASRLMFAYFTKVLSEDFRLVGFGNLVGSRVRLGAVKGYRGKPLF